MVNLKDILEDTLKKKQQKNPLYSIRALARDLSLNQTHLSRVLKGELRPTPLIAYRVGQHLQLSSDQTLTLIAQTLQ